MGSSRPMAITMDWGVPSSSSVIIHFRCELFDRLYKRDAINPPNCLISCSIFYKYCIDTKYIDIKEE